MLKICPLCDAPFEECAHNFREAEEKLEHDRIRTIVRQEIDDAMEDLAMRMEGWKKVEKH